MMNNMNSEDHYKKILEFQLSLNLFGCEALKKEQEKGGKIKNSDIKLIVIKNLVLDYFKNFMNHHLITEVENYFNDLQNRCENYDYFQIIDEMYKELFLKKDITGPWLQFSDEIGKIFKNHDFSSIETKYFYRSYCFLVFMIWKKIHEILINTNGVFPEQCYQLMQITEKRSEKNTKYLKNSIQLDIQDYPLYQNFYNYFIYNTRRPERDDDDLEPNALLFLINQTIQNLSLWLIKYQLGLEPEKVNFFHFFNMRTPGEKMNIQNGTIVFLNIQKKYKRRKALLKSNVMLRTETLIWEKNSETIFYVETQGDYNSGTNSITNKLKRSGIGDTISFTGKYLKTIELLLGDEKIHGEIIKNMKIKKILT